MRTLAYICIFALCLGASAQAQTAGTTFPNNQDPSTTSSEQSMQEVGGPSNSIAVDVQDKVKPAPAAPKPQATHHSQTTTKTKGKAKAKPVSKAATPQ